MEKMIQVMKDRSERFTSTEIQAEILRQQIQELEEKTQSERKNSNSSCDVRLELLKQRLAKVQQPADLSSQGRAIMGRYWKMMVEIQNSQSIPSNAEDILEDFYKWMEAVENEQGKRYTRELNYIKHIWAVAQWQHRRHMLSWLGRQTIRRFAFEKPRYHVGRAVMGWAMKFVKK